MDGDIQLNSPSNRVTFEGRVEVCQNEVWGTVCGDSLWNLSDAQVACRQLGISATGLGTCILNTIRVTHTHTHIQYRKHISIFVTAIEMPKKLVHWWWKEFRSRVVHIHTYSFLNSKPVR